MRSLLLLLTLLTSPAVAAVDTTQAEAMLLFLRACHAGKPPSVEPVMLLPGTQLIVAQQNISRRITAPQYQAILTAACKGEIATITPSEPGARAQRGVQGLTTDVAPSLLWGRDHIPYLEQRLALARENKRFGEIVPLAEQNLPETLPLNPKLYFVMGGRAGAAAFDDAIYIDLLSDAWRSREKNAPMTAQQMVEFFAHETHHIGYGRILDQRKQQLHLTDTDEQTWRFLTALLMEGSATLLINGHGSFQELERQEHIQADLARLPALLAAAQSLLQRTSSAKIDDLAYQAAIADFFGEGYHATGARLLFVIEQVQGKPGVLRVMDDPRTLLTVYNACAAKTGEAFRFDAQLAKKMEQMGAPH